MDNVPHSRGLERLVGSIEASRISGLGGNFDAEQRSQFDYKEAVNRLVAVFASQVKEDSDLASPGDGKSIVFTTISKEVIKAANLSVLKIARDIHTQIQTLMVDGVTITGIEAGNLDLGEFEIYWSKHDPKKPRKFEGGTPKVAVDKPPPNTDWDTIFAESQVLASKTEAVAPPEESTKNTKGHILFAAIALLVASVVAATTAIQQKQHEVAVKSAETKARISTVINFATPANVDTKTENQKKPKVNNVTHSFSVANCSVDFTPPNKYAAECEGPNEALGAIEFPKQTIEQKAAGKMPVTFNVKDRLNEIIPVQIEVADPMVEGIYVQSTISDGPVYRKWKN